MGKTSRQRDTATRTSLSSKIPWTILPVLRPQVMQHSLHETAMSPAVAAQAFVSGHGEVRRAYHESDPPGREALPSPANFALRLHESGVKLLLKAAFGRRNELHAGLEMEQGLRLEVDTTGHEVEIRR